MSVSRIKDLPYPHEKFETLKDAWEYVKDLRDSLQEEQSERIEDFDQLKLDNVPYVDARTYGMSPSATAAKNRIYLQAAIDGAPTGGVVLVPRDSGAYSMNNDTPLTITHALTLIIQGEISFDDDAEVGQPCAHDLFDITGDDVTIIGQGGKISYSDDDFDQNGNITSAIFHVTGDRFTCRDLTLEDPAQCGFYIVGSADDVISGVRIVGGTTLGSGSGTENYGIEIEGGGSSGIMISNVIIVPNAGGGKMVQGIAAASGIGGHITIIGCYFEGMHDHATYLTGDYNVISGNTANATIGSSFRNIGKYGTMSNNTIKDCISGGIDAYNCDGVVITGNVLQGYGFVGIEIGVSGGYAGSFDNIIVANNSIEGATTGTVYEGIRFNSAARPANNVQIINNTIENGAYSEAARSAIKIVGTTSRYNWNVSGNIINKAGQHGILINELTDSIVADNIIIDAGLNAAGYGIFGQANCLRIYIKDNFIKETTSGNSMTYGIFLTDVGTVASCIIENNKIRNMDTAEVSIPTTRQHQFFMTDASGQVGIGKIPAARLNVIESIFIDSDTAKMALRNTGGTERAFLQLNGGILRIDADSNIEIKPNNTLSATFLADGGLVMPNLKANVDQATAGATENELWVDTSAANVIKLGAST